MIQRIQSLYLSLTILLSILFLNGSFLNFFNTSGSVMIFTFKGIIRVSEIDKFELIEKFLPLTVLIILIPVVSLITILLYKNRKIQLWTSLSGIIISAGFIVIFFWYSLHICNKYNMQLVPGFTMVLPFLILIFNILAYRGILKDDRLIKSYDRLR